MDIDTKRDTDKSGFPLNPLNVCVVSSWFPSREHPFRTLFVPAFARRIQKSGLAVTDITTRARQDSAFEVINEIPVFRISQHLLFFSMFRLLAKLKPDIIHVHAPNFFSSFAIIAAKLLRIPVIATVHKVEVQPLGNIFLETIRTIMLLLCDQIVAVSEATRQRTGKCGIDTNRVRVIHNCAEEDIFKPRSREKTRKLLKLPLEKEIILFVGRLDSVKGVNYLIRAIPLVLREREAILVIVGDGPERVNLQHLTRVLNLQPYTLFLGQVQTEKLTLYYNAADLFVLPSLVEGHPVVLLEAMASGIPVVATDIGGNNESVADGVNGLLVDCADHSALAQAIITILGDEKTRRKFSKEGLRLYSDSFSEGSQIQKYVSEYNRLLAK